MKEEFKEVASFPDYLVSNFGRVKTKSRQVRYVHSVTGEEHFRQTVERFLKVYHNDLTGYKFVQLYKNKKSVNKPIHKLVAETFIAHPKGLDTVNHKDGNKHNNTVDNLEWCTNEYNHAHATSTGLKASGVKVSSSKLNERCISAIKYFSKEGYSHSKLAEAFGVSRPAISLVLSGKTWAE